MLTVEGLSKIYEPATGLLRLIVRTAQDEPVEALSSIDFELPRGHILGLVGPNGAGKSTLLRICATLLEPTSGRVLVDGHDVVAHPELARRRLGVLLADDRALYWRLTGRDNLRFFGVMAGLTRNESKRRADELLERFGLASRDRRVFGYSSGMRIRLGLARALLHQPELLIFDEPTRSLDPMASADLLDDLRALAREGTAILLSNHRLDEVETVCDSVLVLIEGRQLIWTPMEELGERSSSGHSIRSLLDPDRGSSQTGWS